MIKMEFTDYMIKMNTSSIQPFIDIIAENNRLRILHAVSKKELCVSEISKKLQLPQNLTSHHLDVLYTAKLLHRREEGRKVYYSIHSVLLRRKARQLNRFLHVLSSSYDRS